MNTLSWLVYFADVLPVLRYWAFVMGVFPVVVCVIRWANLKDYVLPSKNLLWLFVFPPLGALIPSSDTIYLIAASELGEHVVSTPEAQEIFDKLEMIVNHQLDRLVGEAG